MSNPLDRGDPLEQAHAEFIQNRLPSYVTIWSRFIGNDGRSNMVSILDLSPADEERRARTSQLTYTCLESVLAMRHLRDQLPKIDLKQPAEGATNFLDFSTGFLGFHAHAGRIRDQVGRLGEEWGLKGLEQSLNEFYQRRNVVLHGSKVPVGLVEGVTTILVPAGADESEARSRWHDEHSLWAHADRLDQEFLADYLRDTVDGLLPLLESAFSKVRGMVERFLSAEGIQDDLDPAPGGGAPVSGFIPPPSGQM